MQPCASSSKMIVASSRRQRGAADIVLDVDAAEAERRRLAQGRRPERSRPRPIRAACGIISVAGEVARRLLKGALFFAELEIHPCPIALTGVMILRLSSAAAGKADLRPNIRGRNA